MGEAKRRRLRASQPIEFRDVGTGEIRQARNAGDPVEFLAKLKVLAAADGRGERPVANVACDGCTACCYHKAVDFDRLKERDDDLARLDTVDLGNGKVRLRKRKDGACVHLGEAGCTVYQHRPEPCRTYDCRAMALVSMVDTYDGDRHSPMWIFDPHNLNGRVLKQAFLLLGMIHRHKCNREGRNPEATETLRYALEHIDTCYAAMQQLAKLPPDQWKKILGFDPREMTEDDQMKAMQMMTAGLPMA